MGLASFVAKHPKTVLALWIVAIVLLAPFAAQLDKVLKFRETEFIPSTCESYRAQKLLEKYFADKFNESRYAYLVLDGIDINASATREAYHEFRDWVLNNSRFVVNVSSYYDIVEELRDNATKFADEMGNAMLNISTRLLNLSKIVIEAMDEAVDRLREMPRFIDLIETAIKNVSTIMNATVFGFEELCKQMKNASHMMAELDRVYVSIYANLSQLHVAGQRISETIRSISTYLDALNRTTVKLLIDVPRIVKLIDSVGGYSKKYLTQQDIARIVNESQRSSLGPVDPRLVVFVYNATASYARVFGAVNVSDTLLARTILEILESTPLNQSPLLKAYGYALLRAIEVLDEVQNRSNVLMLTAYTEEDLLPKLANEIALESIEALPKIVAFGAQPMKMDGITLPPQAVVSIVNRSVDVWLGRINETMATIDILQTLAPSIKVLPKNVVMQAILEGASPSLALEILNESPIPVPSNVKEIALSILARYDPRAEGVLMKNGTVLKMAVLEATKLMLSATPLANVSSTVLEELYASSCSPSEIEEIAKSFVVEEASKHLTQFAENVSVPEKDLRRLIDVAVSEWRNVVENASYARTVAIEFVANVSNMSVDDVAKILEGRYLEVARKLVVENIVKHVPNASEEVVELVNDVANLYPCSYSDLVEKIVEFLDKHFSMPSNVSKIFESMGVDIDTLRKLLMDSVRNALLANASKISENDVEKIASYLYQCMEKKFSGLLNMLASSDGRAMVVMLELRNGSSKEIYEDLLNVKEYASKVFNASAYLYGIVPTAEELKRVGLSDIELVNRLSMVATIVVLLLVVRSLVATAMPFLGIASSLVVAFGATYFAALYLVPIHNVARTVMMVTAMGLGIDYATYYVSRFREFLAKGLSSRDAAREALARSIDAISASALTDIIAFASLSLAWDVPYLKSLGVAIPIAVATVYLASITLIPAITALVGGRKWFWWPFTKFSFVEVRSRFVATVTRFRWIVVALLLLVAIPSIHSFVTFSGSHDISLFLPERSDASYALNILEHRFSVVPTSTMFVVLETRSLDNDALKLVENLSRELAELPYVSTVYGPTRPFGTFINATNLSTLLDMGGDAYVSKDRRYVLLRVVLSVSAESNEALKLVDKIRSVVKEFVESHSDKFVDGVVGGTSAMLRDLDEVIEDRFWHRILPVAIALMFLSLLPTLKSVRFALATMITIFVCASLSLWISSTLFREVFGRPLMWVTPFILLVVLMGVGIDYNSFVLVRAREELRRGIDEALAIASGTMGKLVLGLATILCANYSVLLATKMWGVREMGFTLALGVALTCLSSVYVATPALVSAMFRKHAASTRAQLR